MNYNATDQISPSYYTYIYEIDDFRLRKYEKITTMHYVVSKFSYYICMILVRNLFLRQFSYYNVTI